MLVHKVFEIYGKSEKYASQTVKFTLHAMGVPH